MPTTRAPWAAQQIAEFLASVSSFPDEESAVRGALERAAEALEAEFAVLMRAGRVEASLGFRGGEVPSEELIDLARGSETTLAIDGLGICHASIADLEDEGAEQMMLLRSVDPFDPNEISLLRSMARVLAITLKTLRTLVHQRHLHDQLQEREQLLDKLVRIQQSISHRAPLQEVLDSITAGARELLPDDVVGLRLIDPDDPSRALLVSTNGVAPDLLSKIAISPLREGAGGQAILRQELVVIEDYAASPQAIEAFANDHLQAAMAAPVFENGQIAGSLVVASHEPSRRYSTSEREMLLALAEHASLAVTDAKIVEAMREAQLAKEMFLAMVSHELKTPLTVIMGVLETLRSKMGDLPAALVKELMESACDRASDLDHSIDMLLRGARAQLAGHKEETALVSAIREATSGFNSLRPVRVGDIPAIILSVDPDALRQILGALLENAISHSPMDSAIQVEASVGEREVIIEVSNTGTLPAEVDSHDLFEPFRRGGEVSSSGVGLGLYVAAKLAESMEGRITAKAADGLVTFSFSCPIGVTADSLT